MFLLGLWWPNVDPPKCNGSDKRWWRHNHSSSWHKGWLLTNLWRQEEARVCWAVPNLAAESFTHIVCSGQHQKPLLKMKTCPKRPRPPKTLYRRRWWKILAILEASNLATWLHRGIATRCSCSVHFAPVLFHSCPGGQKSFNCFVLSIFHSDAEDRLHLLWQADLPSDRVSWQVLTGLDRSWQVLTGLDSDTTKLLTW